MKKLHRNCKELYETDHKVHNYWISKYAKISRNLQADEQPKKRLEKIKNQDNFMLFQFLNKRVESDKVENENICEKTTRKRAITTNCTIQIFNQIFSKIS